MTTLQQIKKLKWVKAAYSLGGATYVTTKPGMLKTVLTNSMYDLSYGGHGDPLKEPVIAALPAYRLRLGVYNFSAALVKKPPGVWGIDNNGPIVFPCVNDPRAYLLAKNHNSYRGFCLGYYEPMYQKASDAYQKLMVAAEFLQTAETDRRGGNANRTLCAYSMGVVGDEMVVPDTSPVKEHMDVVYHTNPNHVVLTGLTGA